MLRQERGGGATDHEPCRKNVCEGLSLNPVAQEGKENQWLAKEFEKAHGRNPLYSAWVCNLWLLPTGSARGLVSSSPGLSTE
jgi:hypothetical protein